MNKIAVVLIPLTLALSNSAWSQKKLTVSAFTGIGASWFSGSGAVNNAVYHRHTLGFPDIRIPDTMTNPYGRKPFTNFVAGAQADIIFPSKWILQLGAQYEYTGSRLTIDSVTAPTVSMNTNGVYTHYYDLVSVNPQVGRIIFQNSSFKVIVHGGFDFVINIALGERANYKDELDGRNYSLGGSGGNPEINDRRITAGASFKINRVSIDINYKHGIANYNKYNNNEVYSRLIHFRLAYTFLNKSI